jgi:hypothetical protein
MLDVVENVVMNSEVGGALRSLMSHVVGHVIPRGAKYSPLQPPPDGG